MRRSPVRARRAGSSPVCRLGPGGPSRLDLQCICVAVSICVGIKRVGPRQKFAAVWQTVSIGIGIGIDERADRIGGPHKGPRVGGAIAGDQRKLSVRRRGRPTVSVANVPLESMFVLVTTRFGLIENVAATRLAPVTMKLALVPA